MTDVHSWLKERLAVSKPNNAYTLATVLIRLIQAPFTDTPPMVFISCPFTGKSHCLKTVSEALDPDAVKFISHSTFFPRDDDDGCIRLMNEVPSHPHHKFHLACSDDGSIPGVDVFWIVPDLHSNAVDKDAEAVAMEDIRRLHRAYLSAAPGDMTLEDVFATFE